MAFLLANPTKARSTALRATECSALKHSTFISETGYEFLWVPIYEIFYPKQL